MNNQDWLVTEDGQTVLCETGVPRSKPHDPYRLYRFLTEVEDILEANLTDRHHLEQIRPLVRHLLKSSDWLQYEIQPPKPDPGWSVTMLYDEPGFPLTLQMVAWLPGQVSPIHNHATWGVVALVSGQEKNTLWRRVHDQTWSDRIEPTTDLILNPGDIISFLPDAIHCVETLSQEPTVTFNLYGLTDYQSRFRFDPKTHTATLF